MNLISAEMPMPANTVFAPELLLSPANNTSAHPQDRAKCSVLLLLEHF